MLIRLRECAGWSAPLLFANLRRQVFLLRGPNEEVKYQRRNWHPLSSVIKGRSRNLLRCMLSKEDIKFTELSYQKEEVNFCELVIKGGVRGLSCKPNIYVSWSTSELRARLGSETCLSPPVKYFYWPFQDGTSFVDHLCFFCLVFDMPLCMSV